MYVDIVTVYIQKIVFNIFCNVYYQCSLFDDHTQPTQMEMLIKN